MTEETGTVKKVENNTAWVRKERSSACESCSARHHCVALEGGRIIEIEAINDIGARVGDLVELNLEPSSVFTLSFLLYLVPALSLVIGAIIGQQAAVAFELNENLMSALTGFIFLIISFIVMKLIGKRLVKNIVYHPKIIKILKSSQL